MQVNERMLQMYWLRHVKRGSKLRLTDGREIEVLRCGVLNRDSGPDFSYVRLRMDGCEVVGDVEMHLRASDWYRHGHHTDDAYETVILHVVCEDDGRALTGSERELPQLVMKVPEQFATTVAILGSDADPYLRCGTFTGFLDTLTELHRRDWMETVLTERWRRKCESVIDMLEGMKGDWRQTAFAILSRALGFGINSEPMEQLGRSLPLSTLEKHSSSLFQLEALLLGMAGWLSAADNKCSYERRLAGEFEFLRHKYRLRPLHRSIWKLARIRPANFPQRRVALLAAFCSGGFTFLSDVIEASTSIDNLIDIMSREPGEYWNSHYNFSEDGQETVVMAMTRQSRMLLILNAVIPLLYAYGEHEGRPELVERAEWLLRELPMERTSISRRWKATGISAENAADSQALLYLYKEYCSQNRCLDCRWGQRLLDYLTPDHIISL